MTDYKTAIEEILLEVAELNSTDEIYILSRTHALLKLIEEAEREARIDELKHIDDPINVNLYHEGLISVKDRLTHQRKAWAKACGVAEK